MTQYQLSFTDTQISILKTSLDTRIQRIDSMIQIFSNDEDSKIDATWMIGRYNEERDSVVALMQDLTNATSFLPTA